MTRRRLTLAAAFSVWIACSERHAPPASEDVGHIESAFTPSVATWTRVPSDDDDLSVYGAALATDTARNELVQFGGLGAAGASSETWVRSAGGWVRRRPAHAPAARYRHAMAFDRVRGEVVLFGGFTAAGSYLGDTWVWNGTDWTERKPVTSPSPAQSHSLVYDIARAETILYGLESRLWVWDGTNWAERTTSPRPLDRYQNVAMAYDETRNVTVLFSGSTNAADTWTWDGIRWTLRTPSTAPPVRYQHALGYDPSTREIVVAGGQSTTGDTWSWNGTNWTLRAPLPSNRVNHVLGVDPVSSELLLCSGAAAGGGILNDTLGYVGGTWSPRSTPTSPRLSSGHASWANPDRAEILVFGGNVAGQGAINEMWSLRGGTWTRLALTQRPSPRGGTSAAYDSTRKQAVLFGGGASSFAVLADTWIWDGAAWTERVVSGPPGRYRHQLAYDSRRNETVLFGGTSGYTPRNDTWVWNGTMWTSRSPAHAPPARYLHGMTFDAQRGVTLMFGGTSNGTSELSDTWTWDGSDWAPVPDGPPYRGRSMGFDAARGEVVLSAGVETWVWSGSWKRRSVLAWPPETYSVPVVYDPSTTDLVLFGGNTGGHWRYVPAGQTCSAAAPCRGGLSCVDGVCCQSAACGTCETCAGYAPGRCTTVGNAEDADTCSIANGHLCDDRGACKLARGVLSADPTMCASGIVADGVCCETTCEGSCVACRADLKASSSLSGVCDFARSGLDPHDNCAADTAESCGQDGTCDGRGGCRRVLATTACGPVSCVDDRATARICDGFGVCSTDMVGLRCGAYACREGEGCATACSMDGDCAPRARCTLGACVDYTPPRCEDGAVVSPDGTRTSCGAYACVDAACKTSCSSVADCVFPSDCAFDGRCVISASARQTSDPTAGCSTVPSEGAPARLLCALAVLGARGRRRTRRAAGI